MNSFNFLTPTIFSILSQLLTQLFQTVSMRDLVRPQLTAFAVGIIGRTDIITGLLQLINALPNITLLPIPPLALPPIISCMESIPSFFLNTTYPPSNLTEDRKLAFDSSLCSHNANEKRYDHLRYDVEFSPGDLVFVVNGNKLNRSKLDPIRIRPFPISEKVFKLIYQIRTSSSTHGNRLFHISKMIPCSTMSAPQSPSIHPLGVGM